MSPDQVKIEPRCLQAILAASDLFSVFERVNVVNRAWGARHLFLRQEWPLPLGNRVFLNNRFYTALVAFQYEIRKTILAVAKYIGLHYI